MKCDEAYGHENGARYKFLKLIPKEQEEEIRAKWKKDDKNSYEEFEEWEKIMNKVFKELNDK